MDQATPTFAEGIRLTCDCGSAKLCICSTLPVFVYTEDGQITQTVIPSDRTIAGGVARCTECERFWIIDLPAADSAAPAAPWDTLGKQFGGSFARGVEDFTYDDLARTYPGTE